MNEEEKKAKDDLFPLTHINGYINLYDQKKANIYTSELKRWQNGVKVLLNLIKKQQAEIEKKNKMIDLMAVQLSGLAIFDMEKDEPLILGDKEDVKEYIERKIEKGDK